MESSNAAGENAAEKFNLKTFVGKFSSTSDLIKNLPEEFHTHFTLMHKSGSNQKNEIEPKLPRVITFGKTAETILAFASSMTLIEVITFDPEQKSYNFSTIADSAGANPLKLQSETDNCSSCHTEKLRPNWEPYFFWPGAYGSEDDSYIKGGQEEKNITEFLQTGMKTTPYAFFPEAKTTFTLSKLGNGNSRIDGKSETIRLNGMPNTMLLNLLVEQNIDRGAKLLTKTESYQKNKYLIAATVAGCIFQPSESGFGSPYVSEYAKKDARVVDAVKVKDQYAKVASVLNAKKVFKSGNIGWLTYIDALFDLNLKITADEFSLSFKENALAISDTKLESFPFNDGTVDYSSMMVAVGLSKLDNEFKNLARFACRDGNTAFIGTHVQTGWTYCRKDPAAGKNDIADNNDDESWGKRGLCLELAKNWK